MKLTKQQENCPYCHLDEGKKYMTDEVGVLHSEEDLANGPSIVELRIIEGNKIEATTWWWGGEYGDFEDERYPITQNINFCPMCGRKLNEEEE
ncbi:hypothetical protein [Limosilactobacillus caviae]|uniref:hypothetical protein n=1 Tax=Limosilactobacillus caviae TaxID=1769424 RepID=UPI00129AF56E|nr:hypothetical protein [Limosilactobacillus caviae]MCD7123671.1 hypothetical protein [Limosilactobacillus caviae]MRH46533.1 hypothetical protein [Limosilactobacillus reuteri]